MDNNIQVLGDKNLGSKIGKVRWSFLILGLILIVLGGWYLLAIGDPAKKEGFGGLTAFMAAPIAFLILAFGFLAVFPAARRLLKTRNQRIIVLLVVVFFLAIIFFLGFSDQMKELIGAWSAGSR